MITIDDLEKYYEHSTDEMIEYDNADGVCYLYAYLTEEGELYNGNDKLYRSEQFRVTLQGDFLDEDGDWNHDYFANPEKYIGWQDTLEEMLEKLNEALGG